MPVSALSQALNSEILAEIASRGPIPFARYMELCLYHPLHGYYTRGVGGGGGRDYLTSSGIHRLFGVVVARQAEEMWRRLGMPERFVFVEFGPGEGCFARDFLEAAEGGDFAAALSYCLVERSPVLRARQARRLAGSTTVPLRWGSLEDLERAGPFSGCLFANEVLDAFPVHRVIGTAEGPREVHVAARGGVLEEMLLPPSTEAIGRFLADAGLALEEGQEVDLNLAAPRFIERVARLLSRGYLIVVDYGHEARELYHPSRRRGTLRAIHRHRINEEFLSRPGDQDLTAHLDFTALRACAARAGASCLGLTTQSRFLLALGALDHLEDLDAGAGGGRDAPVEALLRRLREREALKDLVLPDRMGEKFRVLVLGVGDAPADLAGLGAPWASLDPAGRPAGTAGLPL